MLNGNPNTFSWRESKCKVSNKQKAVITRGGKLSNEKVFKWEVSTRIGDML